MKYLLAFLLLFSGPTWPAVTCNYYVDSNRTGGADSGGSWTDAYLTLVQGFNAASAGDVICVDDGHSESSSNTISWPSTGAAGAIGNPVKIIVCVTDTSNPVTSYSASANVTTTGPGDAIVLEGFMYFWGIYLAVGDQLKHANYAGSSVTFENSKLEDQQTDSGSFFGFAADSQRFDLIDTDLESVWFQLKTGGTVTWNGGTYSVDATPHAYFIDHSTEGGIFEARGVNMAAWNGSTALIDRSFSNNIQPSIARFTNSKLCASCTLWSGTTAALTTDNLIEFIGSDDADEYWRFYGNYYAGTVEADAGVYRTGGASYDGTNEFSLKMETNASAKESVSCIRKELTAVGGIDATTSANVAAHITYDDATPWDNTDICIEVFFTDATDLALHNRHTTCPIRGDASSQASFTDVSATVTWNGTGGTPENFTNANEETIDLDFTGADEGVGSVWINFCKPSSEVWVDWKVDVTWQPANDSIYEAIA